MVTVTDGPTGCTASVAVFVLADTAIPENVEIAGDSHLSCTSASLPLLGSTSTPNSTYAWTGPGGITSDVFVFNVTEPGTYTLVVTAPNGCTDTATTVIGPVPVPVISNLQITNDINGQGLGAINFDVTSSSSYMVLWFLNGQPFGNTQNLTNLHAGIYNAVVITQPDACVGNVTAIVDNIVASTEPSDAAWWEVSPNPANDFLDVHFRGERLADADLVLYNMLGQQVRTAQMSTMNFRLDLKNLAAGQYQLMIRAGKQGVLKPVVIQK